MLSEENRKKIILTGLYKCEPNKKYRSSIHWDNLYWCYNWTFKPYFGRDNELFMEDTYFNDSAIHVTDENFNEFELIFDFNDVKKTNYPEEYNSEDTYHVAIDSGGMYCGGTYFKKKNVRKSKEKLIELCKSHLSSAEYDVKQYKRELEELENGTHYKLKY